MHKGFISALVLCFRCTVLSVGLIFNCSVTFLSVIGCIDFHALVYFTVVESVTVIYNQCTCCCVRTVLLKGL